MIEVCLAERKQPFISGAWGNYTIGTLVSIETLLDKDAAIRKAPEWADTVKIHPVHNRRTEDCEAYWDLHVICYERAKEIL